MATERLSYNFMRADEDKECLKWSLRKTVVISTIISFTKGWETLGYTKNHILFLLFSPCLKKTDLIGNSYLELIIITNAIEISKGQ